MKKLLINFFMIDSLSPSVFVSERFSFPVSEYFTAIMQLATQILKKFGEQVRHDAQISNEIHHQRELFARNLIRIEGERKVQESKKHCYEPFESTKYKTRNCLDLSK